MMGFFPRKLISESINTTIAEAICPKFCFQGNTEGFCPSQCLTVCSDICRHPLPSLLTPSPLQPPPPPPPQPQIPSDSSHQSGRSDILSPLFIIILAALGATFIIVCAYVLFVKYYPSRRRRRRSLEPERDETHDDFQFLDEDRGPVIEHHIWYINTVGLQPSVINAITICKYKRDDGLIEGTECAVCLNEFQEDETLRLLPKCNHAFHIPCIDTWLRSHTNCPMCRAAIVKNTASASSSSEPIINDFEAQVENNGESNREMEERVLELGIEREEEGELDVEDRRKSYGSFKEDMDGIQPMRRSVSLDSLSASKINLVFANIVSEGNLDKQLRKVKSNSRRFMGSSSMKRSSSSGKFSLSKHSRSQSPVVSLRRF